MQPPPPVQRPPARQMQPRVPIQPRRGRCQIVVQMVSLAISQLRHGLKKLRLLQVTQRTVLVLLTLAQKPQITMQIKLWDMQKHQEDKLQMEARLLGCGLKLQVQKQMLLSRLLLRLLLRLLMHLPVLLMQKSVRQMQLIARLPPRRVRKRPKPILLQLILRQK